MKIHIPFTNIDLYLGKAAEAARRSVMYGSWQNTFASMIQNAGAYRIGFETLYTIYNNVADVRQAIKRRRNAFIREGYRYVNKSNPNQDPDQTEVQLSEAVLNGTIKKFSVIKSLWLRDRLVAGNAFLQIIKSKSGKFLGLDVIDPRTMAIVSDKYGNVLSYKQQVYGMEPIIFQPDEIIHSVDDYSTSNPVLGCSPIEQIVWEARGEMAAQTTNFYFYENNSVPSHLLIIDPDLSDDQMKDLKKDVEEKFKGTENRFKSGIIPHLKDIKTIVPSQKEMQFIETRKFTVQKLTVALGVDKFLLGYTEGVQRSNGWIIRGEFYENTVRPDEMEFEQMVNEILYPRLGITKIKYEVRPSNYEDARDVAEISRLDVAAGIMTINEARKMRNLPESDNELADEHLYQGTLIDDLGNEAKAIRVEHLKEMKQKNANLANLLAQDEIIDL